MHTKMDSKENGIRTCKHCGNDYVRQYCDFCKRKARWNQEKYLKAFTPRLQADLQEFKSRIPSVDLLALNTGKGLFITGIIGCGKSLYGAQFMMASIRQTYITQKGPKGHAFVTVLDLLEKIKGSYNENEPSTDFVQFYSDVDFLVLDDLGAEKITEWSMEKLYQIINHRYEFLKPTVITSNLSLEELADQIGDRIPSRIKKMTRTKKMKEIDYRLQKQE